MNDGGRSLHNLRLRQRSPWNGFDYELADGSGRALGGLHFPTLSQAKNARLAFHPTGSAEGDTRLVIGDQAYRLRFEYLTRGMLSDLRYTLESPAGDVSCSADIVYVAGQRLPSVRVTAPVAAGLMPTTAFWRKRFPVTDASGRVVGEVYEPRAFSLRFEYRILWPEASPPLQAFLLALALLVRR
jgi:hypothetical protein